MDHSEPEAAANDQVSAGNLLADGDSVITIRGLKVKGAGQTLRKGIVIKSIRLTGDAQEIGCRFEGIKSPVLLAEFVHNLAHAPFMRSSPRRRSREEGRDDCPLLIR